MVADYLYLMNNYTESELDSIQDSIKNHISQQHSSDSYDWFLFYYVSGRLNIKENNHLLACENYKNAIKSLYEINDNTDLRVFLAMTFVLSLQDGFFPDYKDADRLMKHICFGIADDCERDLTETGDINVAENSLWALYLHMISYEYTYPLERMRYLYESEGFFEKALDSNTTLCEIYVYLIKSWLMFSSFHNIDGFMEQYSQVMMDMSSLTLKANHEKDRFTKYSYNALLMNKGFLLAAEQSLDDIIKSNGDSLAFDLFKERERLQSSLKEIAVNQNISEERVAEINDSLLLIQRQLARKAEQYGYLDFLSIKYDSIRNALKDNEYIVDFTDYAEENGTTQYVAYVFNKQDDFPHLMKVFTGGELDSLKDDLESHKLYEGDVASNIVKLICNPIKETIDIPEGATVYFIPSGELHQLSLESLPIEGNYKFIRLSSAREVIKRHHTLKFDYNTSNAVLYGGLEYDLPDETMKKEHEKYVDRIPSYVLERGDDSIGNSRNQGWKDLPGTEEEVNAVENVLKNSHEIRKYTGSEGTEESFLSLHGHAPQIMLMSTHGFYYTPKQAENKAYFKGYTDAMSLSGLILSGGNRAWRGESLPEGVLPGILTADKISRMNFEGLDLVVLSACQTGQGKVTPEGVYGLQRAFKKAGAGTIVMTLWNVDDKATKDFMVRFFENLALNGWNKRKAFDDAKMYIKSKYKEPYYWAGFVMLD